MWRQWWSWTSSPDRSGFVDHWIKVKTSKRIKFARILATEALDDLLCGKFLRERRGHYGIGEAPSDDAAAVATSRRVTTLWCDAVAGVEVVHGVELIA
jgi:hypothetical protein